MSDHQSNGDRGTGNMDLYVNLMKPSAYPHAVGSVDCVETLLSWVFLTGEFAYKIKKPLHLDFVDFSTLARRHHYCLEEIRCNRAFAPELYIDVVPIVRTKQGNLIVAQDTSQESGHIVDWAVKMWQFEGSAEAEQRLASGLLSGDDLRRFGETLAAQHRGLDPEEALTDPAAPMIDNFDTLRSLKSAATLRDSLGAIEKATRADLRDNADRLIQRQNAGFVRECHGDLHLGNIVLTDDGLRAFDCLEFSKKLRIIDVWSDASFLYMDCSVRGRPDLAYAFVDGYLDVSGDYDGILLLPLYSRYRAMVRAKVAALKLEMAADKRGRDRLRNHFEWALASLARPTGRLIATCGLSGSGKSFWARRLVPPLNAIRLRSDVLRKHMQGLDSLAKTRSAPGAGAYDIQRSDSVYRDLATLAGELVGRGENVIVDCANLRASQRNLFRDAAAGAGARFDLLRFSAPQPELERRIVRRQQEASDPSEAGLDVLEWQLSNQEPPGGSEPHLSVDTENMTLEKLLSSIR